MLSTSCAQQKQKFMDDSTAVLPGVVRVVGKIKNKNADQFVLTIQEVIESGQGLINAPAPGQDLTVGFDASMKELEVGQTIRADMKERMGVDASQSSYVIIQYNKSR